MDAAGVAQTITGLFTVGAMASIWWDIRSIRGDVKKSNEKVAKEIDGIKEKQNECQKKLPLEYASKDDSRGLWERTDRHAEAISFMKGLQKAKNGAGG